MGIFDRFKKQDEEGKKEIKKSQLKVAPKAKKEAGPKKEKIVSDKPKRDKKIMKKEFSLAYRILKSPLVTERAADLNVLNQYVFKVYNDANKPEIKKAIQDLYGVEVKDVNILKSRGKVRRVGRHEGWHPGFKKAIITLAEGEKIEIIAR